MKKIAFLSVICLYAVSHVMAHPGAPGHTHDGDWPFKVLVVFAISLVVAFVLKKLVFRGSQN